jgi:hypothetical protein
MPSEAAKSTDSSTPSFASFLAGLTAPRRQTDDHWIDDALADDVATVSYEQALRTHARYRRPDPLPDAVAVADPTLPKPPQSVRITEWVPDEETPPSLTATHKTASVTLRMSQAECVRLRKRAADAGLTISAYLRSCIFEVESLRAQVKEALAQVKTESAVPRADVRPAAAEHSPRGWAARLFPGRLRSRNRADA